ncbi:MAG: TspO/MBR family protein [Candidatus Zixiibacteriota bacterium]
MTTGQNIFGLVIAVGLCLAVGFISGRSVPGEWYQELAKPTWTPPNWIFAPVWTILYIAMGIAAWLVWRQSGFATAAIPLSVFLLQLLLNGLWSWFFFGMRNPGLAFADIIILWLAILATMILFWMRQAAAGILILPYLVWVSYASALNFAIWRMNQN